MGPITEAQFIAFGHAVVQPGYDYYQNIYNRVNGKLFNIKQAYLGASVFDPLKLKEMNFDTALLLIDNLAHFHFPEFTTAFLIEMKAELPRVLEHAHADFDWSRVPGAVRRAVGAKAPSYWRWWRWFFISRRLFFVFVFVFSGQFLY